MSLWPLPLAAEVSAGKVRPMPMPASTIWGSHSSK
jgi:hypothetical protein